MINITDFLDALRTFETVEKKEYLPKQLKRQAKIYLLVELDRMKNQIENVDVGD